MKIANIRLLQEPDKSFIFYKESNPFSQWHHHPEYELVLITKGRGKRMVGDNINRFEENDLVLLGPYTPHEWLCDPEYFSGNSGFKGEGLVVQFLQDFLGEKFFETPENANLKKFLMGASRGYEFFGNSKQRIISLMSKMTKMSDFDRLQSLFSIFRIFAITKDFNVLSSPSFMESNYLDEDEPMQKALKFILQNFHKPIQIKDILEITNMSTSSFCTAFKNTYRVTFKDYLLSIRVGYACKLLTDSSQNISRAAYESGFENISNFNRQFKKIKGITPSHFIKEVESIEK
ncbi:MAG: AraC family transcriptional regulator [Bacteroidales bacterium]|nr:AraC family transcriptional regulator [Bacteroidales bacterium]